MANYLDDNAEQERSRWARTSEATYREAWVLWAARALDMAVSVAGAPASLMSIDGFCISAEYRDLGLWEN